MSCLHHETFKFHLCVKIYLLCCNTNPQKRNVFIVTKAKSKFSIRMDLQKWLYYSFVCLYPFQFVPQHTKTVSANIYLLSSKSSTSGRQANLYVSAFCDLELGDAFRRRFPGPNSVGAASIYRHPPPSRNYLPQSPTIQLRQ